MAFIKVDGGSKLFGEIKIQGSKNAVLPMLAACILCEEPVRIIGCPRIQDVTSMSALLEGIGCKIFWEENDIIVDAKDVSFTITGSEHVRVMRSSILLLGAMLGRLKEVAITYPGGCSIGSRPIDIHLDAIKEMNVSVREQDETIFCTTEELLGCKIEFYFPSVGATENVILAAVLATGLTVIQNAAKEPEIVELCKFLKKMGAKIHGEGTGVIQIEGVERLHGIRYQVAADRIAAGTYMAAVAGAGGEVFFKMDCVDQMDSCIRVFQEMETDISVKKEGILLKSTGHLKNVALIRTKPYPGFPTDLQSLMMALLSVAGGTSIIIENIFEARYQTASELMKMGADIVITGRAAVIKGVKRLEGKNVRSYDLRGGAALVIAGLLSHGTTYVHEIGYIERGYEDLCGNLRSLGAKALLCNEKGG